MAPEPKNSLSIRLTEPVVFLRSSDPSGRHPPDSGDPPALVRGLLTLNVVKPTRISSIEVELAGVATTSWPEGLGTRRIDVTEEHKVFSATATFFNANELPCTRRTASVGPGLCLMNDDDDDDGRRTTTQGSPDASTNPTRMARRLSCDTASLPVGAAPDLGPTPPYTPRSTCVLLPPQLHACSSGSTLAESPAQTLEDLRQALRDNLEGQGYRTEAVAATPGRQSSPFFLPTHHSSTSSISNSSPHRLQDNSSEESHFHQDSSLSRHPSTDEVGALTPTHPLSPSSRLASHSPDDHYRVRDTSATRVGQRDPSSPRTGRARSRFSLGVVLDAVKEVTRTRSRSKDVGTDEERGRGRTKVRPTVGTDSLDRGESSVVAERSRNMTANGNAHIVSSQALTSPFHPSGHAEHRDKDHAHSLLGLGRVLGLDREKAEKQGRKEQGHGWKEFKKGTYTYPISFLLPPSLPPTLTHPRGTLTYILRGAAHRPGTFTSKLSCQTPIHVVAAPTISTGEGGGAGEPGPVVVERQWEGRLAYALGLSGRVLVIGSAGAVESARNERMAHRDPHDPALESQSDLELDSELQARVAQGTATLDLTLMPLEKVKIWRIGVYLDERVVYIKRSGKIAWDEGVRRVNLLNIQDACLASEDPSISVVKEKDGKRKQQDEEPVAIPLFPTPVSPHRSPLLQYLSPDTDPSVLAGPGPYTLSATIGLPNCNDRAADGRTARVNFSVKNKNANLRVEHQLRVVMRVEKVGDGEGGEDGEEQDDGEGKKKKKVFDIVVQTPVNVLSCRCVPEYQALPRYCDVLQSDALDQLPCPCDFRSPGSIVSGVSSGESGYYGTRELDRITSTDSGGSSFENVMTNPLWNGNESRSQRSSIIPHSRSSLEEDGVVNNNNNNNHNNNRNARSPSQSHRPPSLVPSPGHGHGHSHHRAGTQPSPLTSRPPTPLAQYQRLVSGQETEVGEAPPSYESVAGSGSIAVR